MLTASYCSCSAVGKKIGSHSWQPRTAFTARYTNCSTPCSPMHHAALLQADSVRWLTICGSKLYSAEWNTSAWRG